MSNAYFPVRDLSRLSAENLSFLRGLNAHDVEYSAGLLDLLIGSSQEDSLAPIEAIRRYNFLADGVINRANDHGYIEVMGLQCCWQIEYLGDDGEAFLSGEREVFGRKVLRRVVTVRLDHEPSRFSP